MVSCKCNKDCLCDATTTANYNGQHTESNPLGSDYWSVNPCQPWVSALFNGHVDTSSNILSSYYTQREISFESRYSYQFGDDHGRNEHITSRKDGYPNQARRKIPQKKSGIPTNPVLLPTYSIIGHPSLRICKFKLPPNLLHLLSITVEACDLHAKSLRNGRLFTLLFRSAV